MSPNMIVLGDGFYVVRTQAGFRKAVHHYVDHEFDGDRKILRNPVKRYPTCYLSLLSFSVEYTGYESLACNCISVYKLLNSLGEIQ